MKQEGAFVLNLAATTTTINHNDDDNNDGALRRLTVYPPSILPSFLPFSLPKLLCTENIHLDHTSPPKCSVEKLSHEQLLTAVANCTMASPSFLSIGGSFRVTSICAAERMPLIERVVDYPSGTSTPWRCFTFALLVFAVLKNMGSPEICTEPAVQNAWKQADGYESTFLLRSSHIQVRAWLDLLIFVFFSRRQWVKDPAMLWEHEWSRGLRRSCFLLDVKFAV